MKPALFALLLAFGAPAPFAEAAAVEEEILVESSRSAPARAAVRRASRQAAPPVVQVRPDVRPSEEALPFRDLAAWAPRLFSRPPPLG